MGKKTPAAPPAPDPTVVAQAQAQANIESATAQQKLNMIGTQGPTGTTGYRADASQPGGYTQYTNLSPAEQQSYDLSKAAENGAYGVAGQQIGRVGEALARPLDLSKLPAMTTSVNSGPLQTSFDPGQAVQGQVGGDLSAARQQAIDAVYGQATSRLDPMWAQREDQTRNRLANQGFSQNSTAAQTMLDNEGRARNDAYNQAAYSSIGAGEDAANALFGRQSTQGQFANQAAAQMYAQNQGQAAFNNTAVGQQFGQDMSNAQLGNTARNQALQEQAYVQNQPINQFTALMGSGQVGTPQGVSYTPSQVGQTDVTGAYALQQQAAQNAANRSATQQSGLMSGLMSLGSAAILASDRRLKRDIVRIGTRRDGLGVYKYRYLNAPEIHTGVMADEVKRVRPDLVVKGRDGYMAVSYAGLEAA